MICEHCRGFDHDSQPSNCKGSTWCDCQHRADINQVWQPAKINETPGELVPGEEEQVQPVHA